MDIFKGQMGMFEEDPKAFAGIDRRPAPHAYDDVRIEIFILGYYFHDRLNRRLRFHFIEGPHLQTALLEIISGPGSRSQLRHHRVGNDKGSFSANTFQVGNTPPSPDDVPRRPEYANRAHDLSPFPL